jgi:hypothetical protein
MFKALTTLATLVALVLPFPVAAQAHDSNGWYWSERYADQRLESYADVVNADCLGWGPWRRSRGGYIYSHFSCGVESDDGTNAEVTVEVLGRRKARVLYNERSVVIR